METVLELIGTQISYAKQQLLDVDRLTFKSESCLVLTGANGSGKTTLMKIAAGLLAPDRATVSFDGRDYSWRSAYRTLRRRVVYLHQFPYMFDASVFDNVAYGLRRSGVSAPEVRARVRRALQWAGLDGHTLQN
ncbi:MAG: ATP-binding cassette domain-containing protein, partial [Gammaproteobacteria bacterium]|nr:ATP-binding cassette domain-containing protein [Gammaproteobacteria bacterium]